MIKPSRHQYDGEQRTFSELTAIDTGPDTLVRQEDAQGADINFILDRFGVGIVKRTPIFTELDFDRDLQQMLDGIAPVREAYNRLPDDLRIKYPTLQSMLTAMETGDLKLELEKEEAPPPPTPPTEPPTEG